jgi:hypothetical protein
MKKNKILDLCPLCGGRRKPGMITSRADVRPQLAVILRGPTAVADSVPAVSSDDQTASGFAEFLLDAPKREL